jgi:hypothetical protein
MANRLSLHTLLKTLTVNVYYQPPSQLQYPCILYKRYEGDVIYADDNPYRLGMVYEIMYIDKNPDSPVLQELSKLSMCKHKNHYVVDNLNHDIYHIFIN